MREAAMPALSILLTGATGDVGGLLLPLLEARGHRIRCLARRTDRLRQRADPRTEIVEGDVRDPASLSLAMAGIDVAVYLIHSMGSAGPFEEDGPGGGAAVRGCRCRGWCPPHRLPGASATAATLFRPPPQPQETGEVLRGQACR